MVREHNYTELTVTGHSKGANKAMYTTIMCNNVTRCVSFDGQGFSKEFLSDPHIIPIQESLQLPLRHLRMQMLSLSTQSLSS